MGGIRVKALDLCKYMIDCKKMEAAGYTAVLDDIEGRDDLYTIGWEKQ